MPTQHHATDMAVAAVVRVLETERALEAQTPVIPALQAEIGGMDGFVEPLHAGRAAGVAPQRFGTFGGGAARAPVREHTPCDDHHNQ